MNRAFFYTVAGGSAILPDPVWQQTGVWISSATIVVSSAWTMSAVTITSGQTQFIYNSGKTTDNTILTGGRMNVSSGGTVTGATLSAGRGYIYKGGLTNAAVIYANARMYVYTGAVTSNDVMSAGLYYVSSGGSAIGLTISNGNAYVYANGAVSGAVCNGGALNLVGGHVYDAVINRYGRLNVSNTASASGVIVESGGSLGVFSGGVALAVTSNAGAIVNVLEGGSITYA